MTQELPSSIRKRIQKWTHRMAQESSDRAAGDLQESSEKACLSSKTAQGSFKKAEGEQLWQPDIDPEIHRTHHQMQVLLFTSEKVT